ncbi:MAG TPA: hypothetical protein VHE61_20375 [Opitutaceae bacterium]|nr:hypothetical protein [Opitutaceae bacterium]
MCFIQPPMETPKTKEERDALFAKLFANMAPTDPKESTVVGLLEPFREQIVQKRKEGFSLRQLALAVKQEPLKISVSAATLMRFLGEKKKRHHKKSAANEPLRLVNTDGRNAETLDR